MRRSAFRRLASSIKNSVYGPTTSIGHVDDPCSQSQLAIGWVYNLTDGKPAVDVYVNGQLKLNVTADIDRPDLNARVCSMPRALRSLSHPIWFLASIELTFDMLGAGERCPTARKPSP